MSYKKALRKLEKLPIGERQLAAGQYVWEVKKGKSHCGCAIGKLLTERQRVKLFKLKAPNIGNVNKTDVDSLRRELLGLDGFDGVSGVLDLTFHEANELQNTNDFFTHDGDGFVGRNSYAARKARYKHVIAWLRQEIADEADALNDGVSARDETAAEF